MMSKLCGGGEGGTRMRSQGIIEHIGGTPKAKPGDERTDFGVPVSQVRLVR